MMRSIFSVMIGMVAAGPVLAEGPPAVRVVRAPGGGIQPQAAVDASGVIHIVTFRGDPGAGDLDYAAWKPGEPGFGPAIRVNSEPGSALITGTVRGAQVAIGAGGRVHVAWYGSSKATPANPVGGVPFLYTRSDPARGGFEPQRNLMTRTGSLDGGGSIAADGNGRVYAAWHGQTRGSVGEQDRRMWIARSADDGATFAPEEPAWDRPTGACACCGTKALADPGGSVYLLYRAATGGVDRGMILLTSKDRGLHFDGTTLDPWRINACPMSTASLAGSGPGVLAAWETRGQVRFARVDPGESGITPSAPPGVEGTRKHPSIAVNHRGETVLAWTEGTGWQKGGSLAWQAFDREGRPIGEAGRVDRGIPTWGLAAVVARPDGSFVIVH